jgi:hypothetical protein
MRAAGPLGLFMASLVPGRVQGILPGHPGISAFCAFPKLRFRQNRGRDARCVYPFIWHESIDVSIDFTFAFPIFYIDIYILPGYVC